jgi:hypothetical protein
MKLHFSPTRAAHAYIGSKAKRIIGEFLGKIPSQTILTCIKNGKFLTDYIPIEKRQEFKSKVSPYRDVVRGFSAEEVYLWIPQNYRVYFEGVSGGKRWALAELQHIKDFLLTP